MEYTHFPEPFLALCKKERVGEIEPEFQAMKSQAGTSPHHIFPLRDCEVQYQVETLPRSGYFRQLGSLSFSQVMREAYPGGVYYYQTQTFRVVRIQNRERKIIVRDEKRYTTKPTALPALIFPNLSDGNVYSRQRYGELRLIECNLQLREAIIGFKERRGPNEFQQLYPLSTRTWASSSINHASSATTFPPVCCSYILCSTRTVSIGRCWRNSCSRHSSFTCRLSAKTCTTDQTGSASRAGQLCRRAAVPVRV